MITYSQVSPRRTSRDRRLQIVESTLKLLAVSSVEKLSTRQIAKAVGFSQPALFRHFRSRDAILTATIEWVREQLTAAASLALAEASPLVALEQFVTSLCCFAQKHPGLPRLLFYDHANPEPTPYRNGLRHLVSMQHELVAELTRQAQRNDEVPSTVDAQIASTMLIALLRGTLLRLQGRNEATAAAQTAPQLFRFWLAAVKCGEPQRAAEAAAEPPPGQRRIATVDVRPRLAAGEDPLSELLRAVIPLHSSGLLEVTVPFRPGPLINLLTRKGYKVDSHERAPDSWSMQVRGPTAPSIVDWSMLEAPEPMERVIEAVSDLGTGRCLIARLPRNPRQVLPILIARGLEVEVAESPDGTALLHVTRPDDAESQ
ncbi:MAG: TetR/AcrR family transcriptional regulator [Nannocystaceae bacterium]